MFGVDGSELLILAVLALIFIGPKELPATMRTVGRLIGKVRAQTRHFTAGIENIMREAELAEMEKRWREENERIRTLTQVDQLNLSSNPPGQPVPVMTSLPPSAEPAQGDPPPAPAPADERSWQITGEPDHSGKPLP
ncbi:MULTISPECIES: Sec-independent protein translocase subunit TatA/TatB [Sphingomonas]|uniref:Sec-independent protein translocase subunit TatA/TatB n=1 Tax=Sphingomonas TaxID=13687 RepID=UPI000DEEC4D9|nr:MULTISPECIES: twin-arginine translocase subunit TatB [Sphingomonas]